MIIITFSKIPRRLFNKDTFKTIGIDGFNLYVYMIYYQNFNKELNFTIKQLGDFYSLSKNNRTNISMIERSLEALEKSRLILCKYDTLGINTNISVQILECDEQFVIFQLKDARLIQSYNDISLIVLYLVVAYTNYHKGYCFLSIESMRRILEVSPNRIVNALSDLESKGIIKISKGFNTNNKYRRVQGEYH